MNDKEIFDWMWTHKPFWERNSVEEIEHNKILNELKEHYSSLNREQKSI